MYQYQCGNCKLDFNCSDKRRVYCSVKCHNFARRMIEKPEKAICPTCKVDKDRKYFWINNSKPSGLHYQCIECSKSKYIDKTTPEFLEKERLRSLRKMRLVRGIDPEKPGFYKTGPKANPETHWNNKGYRYILRKGHINAQKTGKMFQHVFIMSEHLKRPLAKHENVHHKNGIRHDNRIENLELWSKSQPPGQRVSDKVAWCIEFLNEYGYDVTKR